MSDRPDTIDRLREIAVSASWPAVQDRVGLTVAAVLALTEYVDLEEILRVRIGAFVFIHGNTTIVSCQESGAWFEVPNHTWIRAEIGHFAARMNALERFRSYPTHGPFFFKNLKDPITAEDVQQAVRDALR